MYSYQANKVILGLVEPFVLHKKGFECTHIAVHDKIALDPSANQPHSHYTPKKESHKLVSKDDFLVQQNVTKV